MTNIYKIPVIRPHHHLWFRNAIQRYELAFVHGLDKKYNIVKKKLERNASHEKLAQLWFHLENSFTCYIRKAYIPPRVFKSDLAATTLSCQQAQKVVSKKAVSGFKLAKNTVLRKQHCVVI
jgi:hypothetical protein